MWSWLVCVALFAATSASQQYVGKEVQPKNIGVLQSFPSVVQLDFYLFWSTINWSQECVGSILNNRHFLTASSCVSGWSYEPRFRRARAGSSFRNAGGIIFYVQDRINHPCWGTKGYSCDIAVVRTMTLVQYSPLIQQAALASPGSWIPNNLRLSQPGWGRANQSALTNQEVLTADRVNCIRRDGEFSSSFNATVDILCVIPPTGIVSNDDVGSPWIFNGVTVGMVGGVNTVEAYKGLMGVDMAKYTEWVVNAVNSAW